MTRLKKRKCPACQEMKEFRNDVKTCGCIGSRSVQETKLTESSEIRGNEWEISLPRTNIHTLEELLDYCKVDLLIWEVDRFVVNKWEMGYIAEKREDKNVADSLPLYQVKAFLKRKVNTVRAIQEIENLLREAKLRAPEPKPVKKINTKKGGMLEINLTDHHFGKLSWQLETLWANYDVKIATQVFNRALDTLIARSPYQTYKEIWFIIGNDLFNVDDTLGRTTSGTQVESDMRHEKTYKVVRNLMVQAIERLRTISDKVLVICVPGNHDHNATWHLGDSLDLYFSKYDDVDVDNKPSPRKYHKFGQTLIGFTHGHQGKRKDLPLLMTVEAKDLYCSTKFHEWHTGHTHQTNTVESHGIRVRILPALCPPDAWHSDMGFVGNLRSSEAFVWDEQQGLINIVIYVDSDDLIEGASS